MDSEKLFDDPINQETLDRLVDGELAETQRQRVLLALDESNDGWKRCAIAFLESQSFCKELTTMFGAVPTETTASLANDSPPKKDLRRKRSPAISTDTGKWLLTLAASALVAFTLGTRMKMTPAPATIVDNQNASSPRAVQQVSSQTRPNLWQGESMMSHELERELRRLGQEVHREKGFLPGVSPSGQRVLVPYEDVRITPASHDPQ